MPNWREMKPGFVISDAGSTVAIKTGEWRTFKPIIDYARCTNCGWCWAYCPEPAIALVDAEYVINYDFCKGCGICAVECPIKCIAMVREE